MSKKRKIRRGGNFFTRPKKETEQKIENNCESECMKNARILCDNTCKKVAINSLDTVSSNYIEDIIKDNKSYKGIIDKLTYASKDKDREIDMYKKVCKIT